MITARMSYGLRNVRVSEQCITFMGHFLPVITLQSLSVLTTVGQGVYYCYYPYFTDEETKAQTD